MGKKTGKREYALLFVVLICFLIYQGDKEVLEVVIWPFITFIAAAAGLHIYDKNSSPASSSDNHLMQRSRHSSLEEFGK